MGENHPRRSALQGRAQCAEPAYALPCEPASLYRYGPANPDGRTKFPVIGRAQPMNARDLVVMSAQLALDRVRAFIEVVDQY